jgi:hypothetical protein
VEAVAAHRRRPVLVSHRSTPTVASPQQRLIAGLQERFPAWPFPHLSFWIHQRGAEAIERSRRTRGFLVAALGAAVAGQVGLATVLLADNGYVSVNPPINAQLVGALNSRGTHPTFLRLVNRLLDLVFPEGVQLENPLEDRTRAEALSVLHEYGCERLLTETRSCSRSRFEVETPHCGVCSQCVDRRFATIAADLEDFDLPDRYAVELFTAPLQHGEARVFATSYVGHAYRVARLTPEALFVEFPVLEEALDLDSVSIATSAESLAGVLKRHANQVRQVIGMMISRHGADIALGALPDSSLLRMILGSVAGEVGIAAAVAEAEQDIPADEPVPAAADQPVKPQLQRAGKGWLVSFESEKALVLGSVGMSRLVRLLKAPGQQLSALDLVTGSGPSTKSGKHRVIGDDALAEGMNASGHTGEIIDEVARKMYQQRAKELQIELANDTANQDEGHRLEIRAELEDIEHVLKATSGKGRKNRKFSAEQERARQTTSKTINSALEVLEEEMPRLARHLRDSLKFGHYLSYDPQPRLRWEITA